ncbi:alpha/beta hydrolase [Actinacidiphila acidipaludis]|uniref:Alpha/beta hydrolase n=1 Tax=Actinacidiphila acidipaludis TaxID=2873382 RepID=A0ABS7QDS3_9ACTN|nr:alpha/beta hydrolase [Streptomyces acidipaludis]MBY8881316.1 alpha/beta hydrolase [Streptomyces acidipaludis]
MTSGSRPGGPGGPHAVEVERGLRYATAGGTELRLDLYRAARPDSPVVVYAHGGGWSRGDRGEDGEKRLAPLAAHGVTVASVDYRLAPATVFPGQLHDLKGAVRWLRANGTRLGLATERLGVWGASAGAYLGSLLALTTDDPALEGTTGGNLDRSSAVQAAVHWFGQADLRASAARSGIETRLLPFRFEADLLGTAEPAELARRAGPLSLLSRVSAQAPPFLVAHGDRDRIVPWSEGLALHQALSHAGADSRFELLGDAGHEDERFDGRASLASTAAWLRAVLT